jgi:hypothetical protein
MGKRVSGGAWWAAVLACACVARGQVLPEHVRVVRADAGPGGDGRSWATAYDDLQVALDVAAGSAGGISEIWLGQGVYAAPNAASCQAMGFHAWGVSLYGGFAGTEVSVMQRPPGARSTLSGHQMAPIGSPCGTVLTLHPSGPIVMDRLEVLGAGRGSAIVMRCGGTVVDTRAYAETGMIASGVAFSKWNSEPITIERCDFRSFFSSASDMVVNGRATVIDSQFDHFCNAMGDGIHFEQVTARRSSFISRADATGILAGEIDAEDCTFSSIVGHSLSALSFGSGRLQRCTVYARGDHASSLGAVELINCDINLDGHSSLVTAPRLLVNGTAFSNCRITGLNTTHVFIAGSAGRFTNCVFSGIVNLASGSVLLQMQSGWAVDNCIIWGNSSTLEEQLISMPAGVTGLINHSCVQGWTGQFGGLGNHGLDPLLNPDGSLQAGSPAIDAGNDAAVPAGVVHDRIGNCRFADGNGDGVFRVDMGALEFTTCWANADCSTAAPLLTVGDFAAFLQRFAAGDPWANCDGSTVAPVLNVADFGCFLQRFAAGCE